MRPSKVAKLDESASVLVQLVSDDGERVGVTATRPLAALVLLLCLPPQAHPHKSLAFTHN